MSWISLSLAGFQVIFHGRFWAIPEGQGNEIWITSPEGKHLGTLQLPQIAAGPRPRIVTTNMAFGDADGKILYITACTHLFRIRVKIPGSRIHQN